MRVVDRIERKLSDAHSPARLAIVDQSDGRAGHAGARPEGERQFRVEVASGAFEGHSRLARRRMVPTVLAEAPAGPVQDLERNTLMQSEDRIDA